MITSPPASFEKYHRRLIAGALITPPILFITFRATDISPNIFRTALQSYQESSNGEFFIIILPIIILAIYSFGYFFEALILGVIAPSANKSQKYFKSWLKTKVNTQKNFTIRILIIVFAFFIFTIISPIILAISTIHHYLYDRFKQDKDYTEKLQRLSYLGYLSEMEILIHRSPLSEPNRAFVVTKLEEVKTNIVYILAIYSLFYTIFLYFKPENIPLDMNSLQYSIMTSPIINQTIDIIILPTYIYSLGLLVVVFGAHQYLWLLQIINELSETTDAS